MWVETLKEWTDKQGCESLYIENGDMLLFENGAQIHHPSHGPRKVDAPEHPEELARLKEEYLVQLQKNAYQSYSTLKSHVATQATFFSKDAGPHPDLKWPGWQEEIARRLSVVDDLQRQIDANHKEIPPTEGQKRGRLLSKQKAEAKEMQRTLNTL